MDEKRFQALEKSLSDLATYVYGQIPKLSCDIEKDHKFINEVNGKFSFFQYIENRVLKLEDEVKLFQENHTVLKTMLKRSHDDLESMINDLKHATYDKVFVNGLHESFMDNSANLIKQIKSLSTSLADQKKWVQEHVETRLQDLKSKFDMKPEDIEAFKKDMNEKMESVHLDGTNSTLKGQVLEQQIRIIEKKIENLYLLVKKLELNQ